MLEAGGPVSAFTDAVLARDLSAAAGLLAHDARLTIPPLHYELDGAHEIVTGLGTLLTTFADLRYDVHSRYLGTGSVTDEAVLVGRQTGPFLGATGTGRMSGVPARVITEHDGLCITRISLWPDLAALGAAVAGTDRVIDLTRVGRAGTLVASLRATMPPRRVRLIVPDPGGDFPDPDPPPPIVSTVAAVEHGPGRAHVPKAPIPKSVRKRRSVLAGGSMLAVAGALTTWVALGALRLPPTPAETSAAGAASAADRGPAGSGSPEAGVGQPAGGLNGAGGGRAGSASGGADAPALAPARQLAAGRNTVIIGSDLLFDTDSAKLTPDAQEILDDLVAQAILQDRRGTVVVRGYTDDVGPTAYNLSLSRRRAAAVAAALRRGLSGHGLTFAHQGFGEAVPVKPNTTKAGQRANRRVTVTFPSAGS